ncbi:hypothetical protein [Streptomyces sp. NPDC003077]|uniref:hypothetical protein n=1 Tax=Streptomyces sp. NPDC003077 TaxID=3154443 RepID=UPI0033A238E7
MTKSRRRVRPTATLSRFGVATHARVTPQRRGAVGAQGDDPDERLSQWTKVGPDGTGITRRKALGACSNGLSNFAADLTHLTRVIKRKLKETRYRPRLITDWLSPPASASAA